MLRFLGLIGITFALLLGSMLGLLGILRQKPSPLEWIAFSSLRNGVRNIFIMNPDGSQLKQITFFEENGVIAFDWSANGGRVYFYGSDGVYAVSPSTLHTIKIINYPENVNHMDLSPDGKYWIYTAGKYGTNIQLYRMNANGSNRILLSENIVQAFTPKWSPDGNWIAFLNQTPRQGGASDEIYLLRPDGTGLQPITHIQDWGIGFTWSSDSQWIIFSAHIDNHAGEIYRIRPNGTNLQRITYDDQNQFAPSVSPDGTSVVYTSESGANQAEIYRISIDGSGMKNLSNYPNPDNLPIWSPILDLTWHLKKLIGISIGIGMLSLLIFLKKWNI